MGLGRVPLLTAGRGPAVAVVAVAADLALFTVLSDDTDQVGWAGRDQSPVLVLAAGALMLPVVLQRRRAPVLVCVVAAGYAALLCVTLGSRSLVALLVVLYCAAVWAPARRAGWALAAVLAAHGVGVAYEASFRGGSPSRFDVLALALVYVGLDVATFAAGRWGASAAARRRARLRDEQQQLATVRAVTEERQRIARDLHDLVAHAVTLMILQSAGARRLAVRDPGRAAEAMAAVEQLGQQAVVELRRLLEVLRAADQTIDGTSPDPVGGRWHQLADLPVLLEATRAAGLRAETRTEGEPCALDAGTDLAAYRVLQEALTNATKHAGPGSSVLVTVGWRPGELELDVVDEGPALAHPAPTASGYGLVGLAERVKLAGGRLDAGPRQDRPGYAVRVVLPTVPLAVTSSYASA